MRKIFAFILSLSVAASAMADDALKLANLDRYAADNAAGRLGQKTSRGADG